MFVLALVHTFPFIVFHIWKGDMVHQWDTSVVYWTGVVALLAQANLTIMTLGPYEGAMVQKMSTFTRSNSHTLSPSLSQSKSKTGLFRHKICGLIDCAIKVVVFLCPR